jgi:hypothetical protein
VPIILRLELQCSWRSQQWHQRWHKFVWIYKECFLFFTSPSKSVFSVLLNSVTDRAPPSLTSVDTLKGLVLVFLCLITGPNST